MTSLAKPMSYQTIQKALTTLKEEHEKTKELNKKLQSYQTYLERAFLTGRTDQLIFDGLYTGGQITANTLTGGKIPVDVRYTDNVKDIQQKIYEAEGIPADFTLGIVLDIENQTPPVATHIQVYADNGINWYSVSELERIR